MSSAGESASMTDNPPGVNSVQTDKEPNSAAIAEQPEPPSSPVHGLAFWLVFLGICLSASLTALEVSSVATALPVITHDLNGTSFIWIGSAYTLAATAFVPLCGGLAQVFGRRFVAFSSLALIVLGSALCGAATNMNFLIAARTIQGLGGGGISAANAIIISDLVSLKDRGLYNGLTGIAWAIAFGTGPLIGGALAQGGQWRWIFFINIPLCGLAAGLFALFLRVPTPPGNWRYKLRSIDWIGNALVVSATTACCIALAWSGTEHSWGSAAVLVPLILGLLGLVGFFVYEARYARNPLVPASLLSTVTGVSGYMQTFITSVVMLGLIYYLPVYFQACKGASAIGAGVDQLAYTFVGVLTSVISGASVQKTGLYRPQLWLSWAFVLIGLGLYTTLSADSSLAKSIGYLSVMASGVGALITTTYFPVLAPLPVSSNGPALALFMFLRNFGQVWGVTIGGAILQNQLQRRLPQDLLSQPQISATRNTLAYAAIPLIASLPDELKQEVRRAFADSVRVVWFAALGIAAFGLLSSLFMRQLKLHTKIDEDWNLQRGDQDLELNTRGSGGPRKSWNLERESADAADVSMLAAVSPVDRAVDAGSK